jgi:hypothetical protein
MFASPHWVYKYLADIVHFSGLSEAIGLHRIEINAAGNGLAMIIFAVLRSYNFSTLESLNQAIRDALEELNNTPMKGRGYSRRQQFEEVERETLSPLPRIGYELRSELRATVMKNGHVALSHDKHYYSVPYTLIGCKIKIMYSHSRVDVYHQLQCVATHTRSRRAYGYTTDPQHLASTHKFVSQWSPEMFLEKSIHGFTILFCVPVTIIILRYFDILGLTENAVNTFKFTVCFTAALNTEKISRCSHYKGWLWCPDLNKIGMINAAGRLMIEILFTILNSI